MDPIAVHALADKYDVPALRECAAQQFSGNEVCGKKFGGLTTKEAQLIVEAHYSRCVKCDSALGRLICSYVVKTGLVKELRFTNLAARFPCLVSDVFWIARVAGGKLW